MKNQINIEELGIPLTLKYQISNSTAGFTRVIGIDSIEYNDSAKFIYIKAKTYYFSTEGVAFKELTHQTLNDGKAWIVENIRKIPILNSDLEPFLNPDFNEDSEISEENFPYMLGLQYDVYNNLLTSPTDAVSLYNLLKKGIENDDTNGCFDIKPDTSEKTN